MQRKLRDLEAAVTSSNKNNDLPRTFAEKYDLSLPISTIEDFLSMKSSLQSDVSFKAEFVS